MADPADKSAFERAFVALSYALDRRGNDLLSPIPDAGADCQKLALALSAPERQSRAVVLARELARVIQALDARRLA